MGRGRGSKGGRADWTSVYYHRADAAGIGFDRTGSGSAAAVSPWDALAAYVGGARFEHVRALLAIQEKEAWWWRARAYRALTHYYVPGIPERRFCWGAG